MFAKILRFKQIGKRMVQGDDVLLPRATEPSFLSALHATNDYKLCVSTVNNKALLFFSGNSNF